MRWPWPRRRDGVDSGLAGFHSSRGTPHRVRFKARPGVSPAELQALAGALDTVPWKQLGHAYGTADEAPALLYAVTHGTDEVRIDAWWELWGTIYHQGTVYEATAPAVPFIAAIAATPGHPEQVDAIAFLREAAVGGGDRALQVQEAVQQPAEDLVSSWEAQPEPVQRALLLLASAFPELVSRNDGLRDRLPDELHLAWDELAAEGGNPKAMDFGDAEAMDRQDLLEAWAYSGSVPSDPS